MCACCCHVQPNAMASLSAMAKISVVPPTIPLQLTALASVCAGQPGPAGRNDLNLAALLPRLPKVNLKINGQLAQLAAKLTIGPFAVSESVKLAAQMQVMAGSLNNYVAPSLKASLKADVSALMKLSVTAKLVAQIKLAGLDPLAPGFNAAVSAMLQMPPPPKIILPPPAHLPNITVLATLPTLVKMAAALHVPLSDPAAASMISAKLNAMAALKPPTLSVKMSVMLKLAAVVSAVATITETFGADAFSPAGMARISLTLKAVAGLPFKIPNIDLSALDVLPHVDDVVMGESIAGQSLITASFAGLKPPKIQVSAFLSASIAMQAALSGAVKTPPLSFCTNCNM